MNFPPELKYTKNDEWIRVEGQTATTGITDFAQNQLSDLTFIEYTAEVGAALKAGESIASVESVKAAADVYAPASGTVTEVNEALANLPGEINQDPYGKGWMVKFTLANPKDLEGLMDAAAYEKYCEERTH